ncbi:MAG: ABC transporter ATP-binding protein [Spirochaetota bacterium]|jgi:ABC-type sugar transport system ATPase subunit|nr:ABC transporter ATP-binding protein [Spirochaetota bacterium]
MPHLSLNRVSTTAGSGLSPLSFDVHDGECLALFEAKKTGITLALDVIAGLAPISQGEIFMDGERIDHLQPARRRMGMIFRDFALYPNMTVRENMVFALESRRLSPEVVKGRLEHLLAFLPLETLLKRKPNTLSSLEKALAALARVLMDDPDLILIQRLDRLNSEEKESFFHFLAMARRELRLTIIFATSAAQEAFAIADRVAVLRDGRLIQTGTPEELYLRPIDSGIALDIAWHSTDLLPATIDLEASGAWLALSPSCKFPLSSVPETKLLHGQNVLLCLRPEDVRIRPAGEGFEGRLIAIRKQIPNALLTVSLENGAAITLQHPLRESAQLKVNAPICFSIEAASLLIFDSQTGDALY